MEFDVGGDTAEATEEASSVRNNPAVGFSKYKKKYPVLQSSYLPTH